jgi:hypothetical protein
MKLGVAAAAAAAAVALVAGAALLATTNQGGRPVDLLSELPHGEFVLSLTPWVCLHRGASLRASWTLPRVLWSPVVAKRRKASQSVAKRRKAKREVDRSALPSILLWAALRASTHSFHI